MHEALFTRVQPQDDVTLVTTHDLGIIAGGTGDGATLADFGFNIVNQSTDRNIANCHRIAWLDVNRITGYHRVADSQTLGCQNIGQSTIRIFQQSDKGSTVRIIFNPLDRRDLIGLPATFEVNDTIGLLVTTTTETNRNATIIVAATLG